MTRKSLLEPDARTRRRGAAEKRFRAYGAIAIAPAAEGLVGVPSCSVVEFEIRLRAIYQDARQCQ